MGNRFRESLFEIRVVQLKLNDFHSRNVCHATGLSKIVFRRQLGKCRPKRINLPYHSLRTSGLDKNFRYQSSCFVFGISFNSYFHAPFDLVKNGNGPLWKRTLRVWAKLLLLCLHVKRNNKSLRYFYPFIHLFLLESLGRYRTVFFPSWISSFSISILRHTIARSLSY